MATVTSYTCDNCHNGMTHLAPTRIKTFPTEGLDVRPINNEGKAIDLCAACLVKALEAAAHEVRNA